MEFFCPECKTHTQTTVSLPELVQFSCPACSSLFRSKGTTWDKVRKFKQTKTSDNAFAIGQKARLSGVDYEVTGMLVKRVYNQFFWREYVLADREGNFRFLSESEGHFILLREIDITTVESDKQYAYHSHIEYRLFDKTDAQIVDAAGFFDFELPSEKIVMREYIAPPHMLSFETIAGNQTCYWGEHISHKEIKRAFGGARLPYKSGVGIVQPLPFPLQPTVVIFGIAVLLMIVTHVAVFVNQVGREVLNVTLPFDGKDYISPAFYLRGGAAPLTVEASSGVDNSWANVSVALVNEDSNEEVYANKDIEYYHGYTDGENWTEGSTSEEFNICGVPAGKYHLVISPSHQKEDQLNRDITVKATWRDPSMHNIWMALIGMGIIGIGFFAYNRYINVRRWSESPYSPYQE